MHQHQILDGLERFFRDHTNVVDGLESLEPAPGGSRKIFLYHTVNIYMALDGLGKNLSRPSMRPN